MVIHGYTRLNMAIRGYTWLYMAIHGKLVVIIDYEVHSWYNHLLPFIAMCCDAMLTHKKQIH